MMKRISILVTFVIYSFIGVSQHLSISNTYVVNPSIINPAFNGYYSDLSGFATASSPLSLSKSQLRFLHAGINKSIEKKYFALGAQVLLEERDFFESFSISAGGAYQIPIKNKYVFNAGMNIGLANRSFNSDLLNAQVDINDPTLYSDYYFNTSLILGVGLGFYSTDWEVGFSVPYLVSDSEMLIANNLTFIAYKYHFSNNSWYLKPNILMINRIDQTSELISNFHIENKRKYFAQLGYSTARELLLSAGYFFGNFNISYVFRERLNSNDLIEAKNEFTLLFFVGRSRNTLSYIADPKNLK